jgi:hypothetical protein
LFGLIGAQLLDSRIHTKIGMKITSAVGDIWFVATEGEEVKGFCKLTPSKQPKGIKLRAFYGYGDEAVEKALLVAAANEAERMGAEIVEAIDTVEKAPFFASAGWSDKAASGLNFRVYARTFTKAA